MRTLVWDSMLIADLNVRYSGGLASNYQRYDRWAKLLIAFTSSAAVSGWAIWGAPGIDWIWKVASAIATVVAIGAPIIDWSGSMKTASKLNGGWSALLREYTLLWARVDSMTDAEVHSAYSAISVKEDALNELETSLQKKDKLIEQCWKEVLRTRGLASKEGSPA